MRRLFTLTIFLSAALVFMVQPLAGKILLPVLGGSPAVWSTCIVFFQAALLFLPITILKMIVDEINSPSVHVCDRNSR